MSTDEIVQKVIDHLEKSLMEDLKDNIKNTIHTFVSLEFDEIHKRLGRLEKTMDTWKNDLDEDRDNLRGMRTKTENINTELTEIGNAVDKLPKKLENTVKSSVEQSAGEAIPKAVTDTFNIFSKKVKVIEKPTKFLSRLRFWR